MLVRTSNEDALEKMSVLHVNRDMSCIAVLFSDGGRIITFRSYSYCEPIPTQKLVPWELLEIPINAWYRSKDGGAANKIESTDLDDSTQVYVRGGWHSPESLMDELEYTLGNPLSPDTKWHPCGKVFKLQNPL